MVEVVEPAGWVWFWWLLWSNPDYIPDWRVHTAMPQTWEPRVFPTQTLLEPDLRVATLMKRMGIEAALVHGAAML